MSHKNTQGTITKTTRPEQKTGTIVIKVTRIIVYIVSIIGLAIGIGLVKAASLSNSFSDGTHDIILANGYAIFIPSIIILFCNIFWGILRWFLRGYDEQWRISQIVGKLVGGGLWRILLIVPLFLVSLITITPIISGAIKSNLLAEEANFTPFDPDYATHRLEYIFEHLDELSYEEAYEELQELSLSNIEFDPHAEIPTSSAQGFFTKNASATTHRVAYLTKATLSSAKHFVVFYSTSGDDAITDEKASELAEMLETLVANYKNNLGLDYSYSQTRVGVVKNIGIKNVLTASGLDSDILKTAMPVYVANPYSGESNVLASYGSNEFTSILAQIVLKLGNIPFFAEGEDADTFKFYDSIPSFPCINIGPDSVNSPDLESVTAHEIGHHYAHLSNATFGNQGSHDDFIDETVPNWMAIQVSTTLPTTGVMNGGHYNSAYLGRGTKVKLSESTPNFVGYPPYAFLENYANIVTDGQNKMFDALYHGNALSRLYELAGQDDFTKVMTTLAEKNLTGDYNGKLVNYITPKGEELYCSDICNHTYTMAPASTQYLYFTPDEYQNIIVTFTGAELVQSSLLARTIEGWQILSHASSEVVIDFTDIDYQRYSVVALAISHSGIDSNSTYKIDIVKSDLEDVIAEEGNYIFELPSGDILTDLGDGCYGVDMNRAFEYLNQFMNLGSELLGSLSRYDETGSISNSKVEFDASANVARENISQAQSALDGYKVSICVSHVAPGQSFESVRSRLERSLGSGFTFGDGSTGSTRVSTIISFNAFARQAKAYVLAKDNSDMGLFTINIEPQ